MTTYTGTVGNDSIIGSDDADVIDGFEGNDTLDGRGGADLIHGGAGNDRLVGGGDLSIDTLAGGAGNDTYVVNSGETLDQATLDIIGADLVIEATGEGVDSVLVTGSYLLRADAEIEFLSVLDPAGTSGAYLYGNRFAQTITGSAGANEIADGAGAADTLIGLGGDDIYFVDTAATQLIEAQGGGRDTVYVSVGYTLQSGSSVEALYNNVDAGLALVGNELAQLIGVLSTGAYADSITGGGGADTLVGGLGNDVYTVSDVRVVVVERAGEGNDTVLASVSYTLAADAEVETLSTTLRQSGDAINLTGNRFAQQIVGNYGSNILTGGGGTDTLAGSRGNDTYSISDANTVLVEAASEGNDVAFVSVSYVLGADAEIETLSVVAQQSTDPLNLIGNRFAQQVVGNFGDNVLNGNGGADTLIGLRGNDTYAIADAAAVIIENTGEGNDVVFSNVSYALTGLAEIETLSVTTQQGFENINLIGNGFAQQVVGNFGNNVLNGNGGRDTLIGLRGDDTYAIADADAVIVENSGEGNDVVFSSVSYALTGLAEIETLSITTQQGFENINLIGNGFAQQVVGNFGNNVLNGNGGADTLIGLRGDDTYVVGDARAVVVENAGEGFDTIYARVSYQLASGSAVEVLSTASQQETGAINLVGNGFAQQVVGNNGANVLDGGAGADTLTGLSGADTFRFSTALGGGNVDVITDFQAGSDQLQLAPDVFAGLATGTLAASAFVVGTAATGSTAQIVYDQASGRLFFDGDGNGTGAAVLFATLAPGTALGAADVVISAAVPV